MSVLKILDSVGATTKRTEKESILEKNKDNADLKRVIRLASEPLLNFYVRKVLPYKGRAKGEPISEALDFLENVLAKRAVTGDAALAQLKAVMERLSADDGQVIERILNRDLRVGAGISTFNKIWGAKFLQEWPVMLCAKWEDKDHIEYPAYAQLKSDGMRINVCVDLESDKVTYRSRKGETLELKSPRFDDYFLDRCKVSGVIDGELLVKDKNGKILDRSTSNGICNKAQKGTLSRDESDLLFFSFWDFIPMDVFTGAAKSNTTYEMRLAMLEGIIKNCAFCEITETTVVNSEKEAQKVFQKYLKAGCEGAVLKNKDALWEDRRSRNQIKMKAVITADLRVIGWNEGKNKNKGKLGALIVTDGAERVEGEVGTGFSDEQRNWKPKDVIGKIVEVEYNAIVQSKGKSKPSLFLPVFVCIRDDKTEAETL